MPSPQTILIGLLGGAIGAAGILQGMHWRATRAPADRTEIEQQLRSATWEIEMLRRENESLRALAQGGGELTVPPELVDRVEREFGLHFRSSPVVHRITSEKLRDRITAAIESRLGPSGADDRQEACLLIGWLRPDDHLLTQLSAVQTVGANAWFDDFTGEGWMLDRADLRNIPEQATLIRLLVRILFHQHFPPAPAYPGDDAYRAREALHEGTAAGSEARFYAEKARSDGFMPMNENKEFKQLFAALSPFIQGLTGFPATAGKAFADTLYLEGNESLHAAFRSPPPSTRAIIAPGDPVAEAATFAPPVAGDPILTESAGALGLQLWLGPIDKTAALEIATAWRGDRYLLFPDGENSAALLWDIELSSPEAADRFQAIALAKAAAMADRKETPSPGESAISPENRHLGVIRISPTRLRFLNTAEADTASKLRGL